MLTLGELKEGRNNIIIPDLMAPTISFYEILSCNTASKDGVPKTFSHILFSV